MNTLLGSIVAAAAIAGAATLVTGPDPAAGFFAAQPGGSHEIAINRTAKAGRVPDLAPVLVPVFRPVLAPVRVKTIRIPLAGQRRDGHPLALLVDCEPLVSPLADVVASRRPRQCTT